MKKLIAALLLASGVAAAQTTEWLTGTIEWGSSPVFTSGALTAGRIPLVTTGGALKDDAGLTFTGTGATFQLLTGDGTKTVPTFAVPASETGTGFFKSAANTLTFTTANIPRISFAAASILTNSVGQLAWGNSSDVTASVFDTALTRGGAGLVRAGNAISLHSLQAGNLTATALATPAITSPLTIIGTPGATTYGYKLTALLGDGTTTAASPEVTIATGNATLDGTNSVKVDWPAVTNAASYKLYRTTGGAAPPKLIYSGALLTFTDIGAAGSAETPATANTTGRVLVGDGSLASPSYSFGGATGTGLYASGAVLKIGQAGVAIGGTWLASGTPWMQLANLSLGANFDQFMTTPAAATLQLGAANSATPVAQTLTFQSTTSNDTAGAKATVKGSQGKGTGSGGDIVVQTGITAGSGATANTVSDRLYEVAAPKALTSGAAATGIFEIALPTNNTSVGYEVHYTISFADGTAYAIHRGTVHGLAYRNGAGTVTGSTPAEVSETNHNSGGSNTTDTWSVTAGTGKITVNLTATKGNAVGTVTLGEVSYFIHLSGRHAGVTPL